MFGNQDNCRVENLKFEVVDLDSPYHALLGRLALAKFMVSTHVAYLKMKMSGPKGVIAIIGDYKRSMVCALAWSSLAETLIIAEEKKKLKRAVEIVEVVVAGKSMPGMANPLSFLQTIIWMHLLLAKMLLLLLLSIFSLFLLLLVPNATNNSMYH
jgi:hypothetical protein